MAELPFELAKREMFAVELKRTHFVKNIAAATAVKNKEKTAADKVSELRSLQV